MYSFVIPFIILTITNLALEERFVRILPKFMRSWHATNLIFNIGFGLILSIGLSYIFGISGTLVAVSSAATACAFGGQWKKLVLWWEARGQAQSKRFATNIRDTADNMRSITQTVRRWCGYPGIAYRNTKNVVLSPIYLIRRIKK